MRWCCWETAGIASVVWTGWLLLTSTVWHWFMWGCPVEAPFLLISPSSSYRYWHLSPLSLLMSLQVPFLSLCSLYSLLLPLTYSLGHHLLYDLALSHHLPQLREYALRHQLVLEEVPLQYPSSQVSPDLFAPRSSCLYLTPHLQDPRSLLLGLAVAAHDDWEMRVVGPASAALKPSFWSQRIALQKKIRDVRAVGLLATDHSQVNVAAQLKELSDLARSRGQTAYCISVGRTSETKLLNFPGLELFVMLGCPLTSLLVSQQLHSPVTMLVTPLEYKLAGLPPSSWKPIFLRGDLPVPDADDDTDEEQEVYEEEIKERSIKLHEGSALQASPAAAILRAPGKWVGLDPSCQDVEVKPAEKGQSGIASSYQGEGEGV
jgi:hypothetical protein